MSAATTTPQAYEIETAGGRYVDFSNPDPATIALEDVVHGLAHECRYARQCRRFYSVAEHAVLVSRKLLEETGDVRLALGGLHHDDPEAYLGDIPRPLKLAMRAAGPDPSVWDELDGRFATVITQALGGVGVWDEYLAAPMVKAADTWAMFVEASILMPSGGVGWWGIDPWWPVERPEWFMCGLPPRAAMKLYRSAHRDLLEALSA